MSPVASILTKLSRTAKLKEFAQAHGTTVSGEINEVVKEYIQRKTGSADDWLMAPVIERLLNEKTGQMEEWLCRAVCGSATGSATASFLLLELQCGQRADPMEAVLNSLCVLFRE